MVEEVLASGQQIIADLEVLEQIVGREPDDTVGGAGCVAQTFPW
jgi:hypothetical protein